jgi:beta-glucosidase
VHCDGGPLANTQHDPRWGRVSETYGEDPLLSAAMGVAANLALQNRSADRRWLASSQVTRHYLGYHGANDLPHAGEELIDFHGFADQQETPYSFFQMHASDNAAYGDAEGIMMAMSAFSIGRRADWGTATAPMIPSLVHPYLWAKLRDEWNSDCFAQTDCCDSINTMVGDHHYFPDIRSATLAAVEMGLQASYGPDGDIDAALREMLLDGSLDMELFDARIARTLLTRFRLGEFDIDRNPAFPYQGPYDETLLDGPANRQLAREVAAASVILLKNENRRLPLALGAGKTLAVIGPFANCTVIDGGYGAPEKDSPLACSYLHSYSGYASAVSTIANQAIAEGASAGFRVVYAQGSNLVSAFNGAAGIAAAVAAAQAADVVLLVVGLSSYIEAEGNDRANVTLPRPQQDLVDAITSVVPASKLVLVVVAAGTVDTSYAAADAAIHYMYPGEEAGTGLWDVLSGRLSPSGRLPLTVYRHAYLDVIEPLNMFALVTKQGTGRTYRYANYANNGSAPTSQLGGMVAWYFGHGLSYASFAYSALSVIAVSPAPGPGAAMDAQLVSVSVSVQNTGAVAASEIVQCYVSVPRDAAANASVTGAPIPMLGLQWFTKLVQLQPGAAPTVVTFTLSVNAFRSTTAEGDRVVTGGVYTVYVSGHMPGDPADGAGVPGSSNEVSGTVVLPVMGAQRQARGL